VEWYRKAVTSDSQNPMPFYYLGFAYKEKGRKREAIQAFKEYLARRPDAEDKKDIEDEIYDLEH
jgi:cytochrome c-type biogenesis protein CcmH/NrfG